MSKNIKHELNENFKGFFLYAQKQKKRLENTLDTFTMYVHL
jgi:hypothetical protein